MNIFDLITHDKGQVSLNDILLDKAKIGRGLYIAT